MPMCLLDSINAWRRKMFQERDLYEIMQTLGNETELLRSADWEVIARPESDELWSRGRCMHTADPKQFRRLKLQQQCVLDFCLSNLHRGEQVGMVAAQSDRAARAHCVRRHSHDFACARPVC